MRALPAAVATAVLFAAGRPAAAATPASASRAWGNDGHQIVCEIAWLRLTPAARTMVGQALGAGPNLSSRFVQSCLWADEVRNSSKYRFSKDYHFVNVPGKAGVVDLSRDCGDPAKRCAHWAIRHYAGVLLDQSPTVTAVARAEAVKFLAHFVGDIHQPLHTGRPNDIGGNTSAVSFFGKTHFETDDGPKPYVLHSVWDTYMLRRAGLGSSTSASSLSADVTAAQAKAWGNADVLEWTNESYEICDALAYPTLRDVTGDGRPDVGQAYYEMTGPIVRRRLQQAGVRLAYLLNRIADRTLAWPA